MTVPVNVPKVRLTYPGDTVPLGLTSGAGALFFLSPSHLVATLAPTAGDAVPLILGTDFTISGDGTVGAASLVPLSAMALKGAGVITVRRQTPNVQTAQFRDGDGNPALRFESTSDYSRYIDQELAAENSRAVVIAETDAGQPPTIPMAAQRTNRLAEWDGAANFAPVEGDGEQTLVMTIAPDGSPVPMAITALFGRPSDSFNGGHYGNSDGDQYFGGHYG